MYHIILDISIAFCVLAILFGIGLLGHPTATTGVWQQLPSWLASMRVPLRLERYFYRYHRWFGLLVVVTSAMVLFSLARPAVDPRLLLEPYRTMDPLFYSLLRTLLIFCVLSSLFTFMIGAIIFYRPSVLKHFERWANQPVTQQLIGHWWQQARQGAMALTQRYPRQVGLLLVALGGVGWYLLLPYW
ncbi:MAG: hypothetical protein HQL60_05255 [Magnetococcales bacterium]|nr:hypothetical protein [Magnetococcales bacterium]